jgi:hypothetical protein
MINMESKDVATLVDTVERLGLGLDINGLRNTVTVELDRRKQRQFGSVEDALRFVQGIESNRRAFAM